MQSIELRIDVSAGSSVAATVFIPDAALLPDPPIVLFASPGGGYSRRYFDLQFAGHTGYSEAEHHVREGMVFVAYDHLGCGDSTVLASDELTIEALAQANDVAVREIAQRLALGMVSEQFPPLVGLVKIGIGQSMGGCVTIVMQGRHRTFDGIIPLGYSGLHTVPPLRDPKSRQGLIESTRALSRDTDVRTLSIAERTSAHTHDDMSYPHHWEDVPADILQADTPDGFAFRRTDTWPPAWRSASLPRCALLMMAPNCVAAEAAAITVPVLTAMGERDVCPEPHREPSAYSSSRDVSLFIVPQMAHMHNFASTRKLLWNRIVAWARMVSVAACLLLVLSVTHAARVIDNEALTDERDGADWAAYGRTFNEQHFSPLKQIDANNVHRLGLAWAMELGPTTAAATTPLAVGGVIYMAVGQSVVHAVDAHSGKLLWRYDPEVTKVAGIKLRYGWGSRGLAFWKGRLYVGTLDGRLISIDAHTGKPVWSVMTVDANDGRYITGAPRVFDDKVIIGHGGADFGAVRGYVTAYDTDTGKQLWRFFVVPGNPAEGFENEAMRMAADTWKGEWWKYGGGGTVWNAMTYDPELDRIYLGTGNGAPWNQKIRSPGGGDNLFLCSIVALDARTGEYVWHYQVNPGETWDYTASMDMELATLQIDGKPRKVLMQAPKNGFFYVIDRESGKLISAEKVTRATWAERIDVTTGRPVEANNARYTSGPTTIYPASSGGHNWQSMSYNPDVGLVFVPTSTLPASYNDAGIDFAKWRPAFGTINTGTTASSRGDPPLDAGTSNLVAWDPARQKEVWKVDTPGIRNGGTFATAGNLVFQGQVDGQFKAYAADSGKLLWSFAAGNGIVSNPITFLANGKQYVAVLTGITGGPSTMGSLIAQFGWQYRVHPRRLLVFALDGKATAPDSPPPARAIPLEGAEFVVDPAKADLGRRTFEPRCTICHGAAAVSGGAGPDLRASAIPLDVDALRSVVKAGAMELTGMPRFAELSDAEVEAIAHYLRLRARQSLTPPKLQQNDREFEAKHFR